MLSIVARRLTRLAPFLLPLTAPLVVAGAELPTADAPVATIGSEGFTFSQMPPKVQTDLDDSERRYQQQLHQAAIEHRREQQAILEADANDFLDSKLLQREAAAKHETLEQLVKQVKNPDVTDQDIRAFYEAHKQQINEPFVKAMVPITQYLMEQSQQEGKRTYLAALRTKYSGRLTVAPLRQQVAAEGPSRGPDDARVTIIEFADFQCPFCKQMEPVLAQLLDKYPRDVRVVFRQMPLADVHPDAMHAAAASECARQQGKFWEMHDALFADQGALSLEGIKHIAERLQLQAKPFAACLESEATAAAIRVDSDAGVAAGVSGTPGMFVNGRFLNGAVPYETLRAMIDEELAPGTPQHLAARRAD
jgi:protein-disulfide isomerase